LKKDFEKAILFDFDGVVANSEPSYGKVIRKMFKKHNVSLKSSDWAEFRGLSRDVFFNIVLEKYIFNTNRELLEEEFNQTLLIEMKDTIIYIPRFLEFYNLVNKHFSIALVTSTSSDLMNWIFKNTKIVNNFYPVITADNVDNTKPSPEPYLKAAKILNIPISNCIVIEDSVNGVKSAKKSGAKVIGITTGFSSSELQSADLIIDFYNELDLEKLNILLNKGENNE